jgi:hypothetical protein
MKLCLACRHSFDTADWKCPYCGHVPEACDGYVAFAPDLVHRNDGFKVGYFPRLARLEAGNYWFQSRKRLLIRALRRYFPGTRSFLEIGCGTGFVLA